MRHVNDGSALRHRDRFCFYRDDGICIDDIAGTFMGEPRVVLFFWFQQDLVTVHELLLLGAGTIPNKYPCQKNHSTTYKTETCHRLVRHNVIFYT